MTAFVKFAAGRKKERKNSLGRGVKHTESARPNYTTTLTDKKQQE